MLESLPTLAKAIQWGWIEGVLPWAKCLSAKTLADSRNRLKAREEISLNRHGGAKINGYSGLLTKHYCILQRQISDAMDQGAYRETWVRIQRGWAGPQASESGLLSRPAARAGEGAEVALDGSHLRGLRTDLGSDSLKMAPADRPRVGGDRAWAQSSPSTAAKRKRTWTTLDQPRRPLGRQS